MTALFSGAPVAARQPLFSAPSSLNRPLQPSTQKSGFKQVKPGQGPPTTASVPASAPAEVPEGKSKEIATGNPFHYKVRMGEDVILTTISLEEAIRKSVETPGSRVEMINDREEGDDG